MPDCWSAALICAGGALRGKRGSAVTHSSSLSRAEGRYEKGVSPNV
jgi:hypothetical protein